MHEPSKPIKQTTQSPKDPTAASQTWAIALVASAIFLAAAIGIVVWLVVARGGASAVTTPQTPVDPAIGVKNVTFVLPADMPATYVKSDQSRIGESMVFYDDEATMCSIMLGTVPADDNKTPQDVALERLAFAYAQGVATTSATTGEQLILKDSDAAHDYAFESVATQQSVNVGSVGYTGRQQITLFKQFGNQVVTVGYGCKTETWAAKQAELASLVASITLKTER